MTGTTSFQQPTVELDEDGNRVKIYEEIPGMLTVSFSKAPGMWSGFTMPREAAQLVIDAIVLAR
jgi:hypothetical protein